ncbi:hypothetical protein KL953_07530 [Mycolicibacterium goodii]|uniref:MSMEG_1130 family ribosome hibernation factor n=1 Tax=Mycolicibacterium goodii TaxID=134601 RepID=UPI00093DB8EE|nr:VLRF1 family aeRF1-type release factor [Mycolicibacterium goodii]MBU8808745.1 hypothetical protein [Mycolicibacterium goodii]MBU8820857.1 hypothetical protein [Mycolicibacterium goodii]OKH71049.1 hypothetical protein EB74_26330 [Mycobacterium sp. SWH-M5]
MDVLERIDLDTARDLSQRTDRLGVVSLYFNADPSQNLQVQAIDLRNRYRLLQRRMEADGSERSSDVAAALERRRPLIEKLITGVTSGRGRIMFIALDGEQTMHFECMMPVTNRVVLDDGPFIHPLVEVLDEGRPAGVLLISADDARLLEWRLGELQEVSRIAQQYSQAPHERAGQIGGGPKGQFHTPMREQRQARERAGMQRFLTHVTSTATDVAQERRWERIVVSGGQRWTEPARTRFGPPLRDRVLVDRGLGGLDNAALTAAVTERLHRQHKYDEQQLLDYLCDASGSGDVALGLSEVAAALNAGRVDHLVYDPAVRYAGTVGADGSLYADGEIAPHSHAATPDPRFTERLVDRAFATGARISPVEGAADAVLKDAVGVAAVLRW